MIEKKKKIGTVSIEYQLGINHLNYFQNKVSLW